MININNWLFELVIINQLASIRIMILQMYSLKSILKATHVDIVHDLLYLVAPSNRLHATPPPPSRLA